MLNPNRCQVSLDCVYDDKDGITRSCISKTFKAPFLRVLKRDCATVGDNGIITAKITMKMCNRNKIEGYNFQPDLDKSFFRVIEDMSQTGLQDGYDLSQPIPINSCVTMYKEREIDVCERKSFPIQLTMNGNMPDLGLRESWCYAHAHVKNKIKLYDNEVGDNPYYYAPSPAPLVVEQEHTADESQCSTVVSYLL